MIEKKTILIVDDNIINRKLLTNILKDEYNVLEANNGQVAFDVLAVKTNKVDGVILDLAMPIMDGYTFLNLFYQENRYKNVPVIVATNEEDTDNEIQSLTLGAWDIITKPYNAKIILFRVKHAIARCELLALEQLKYLAEYDTLTGIYNKQKFFEMTRNMLDEEPNEQYVFVRFDIDRFQLINSYFGYAEGDKLLIYIADFIKKLTVLFPNMTYGRIHNDVFCICAKYKDDVLREIIGESRRYLSAFNPDYDIVPTIGIYVIANNSQNIESIYNKASLASKKSKGNYTEFYTYYDNQMSIDLRTEQNITNEMTSAIEKEQFEVYYQPKYDLIRNRYCGAEALIRWNHPTWGILPPSRFIPIFEKNGFITKLDYYVWERVLLFIRKWLDKGETLDPISVNVSRVNLYNPKFAEALIELVRRHNVPPSLLNLELTESAYTDNPQAMSETMHVLQNHGFTIMMDDFGSGYSSLNVLKDIAVDVLKIDMRFLSKTKIEGRGENIVASVIRMAKWLNIPIVAEGVETCEQVAFLRSVGCNYCQGYYFAKPMPMADYEELCHSAKMNQIVKERESKCDSGELERIFVANPDMIELFDNFDKPTCYLEYTKDYIDIIRVNDAYYKLFGGVDYSISESNAIDLVEPEFHNNMFSAFDHAVANKSEAVCEFKRKPFNDQTYWIRLKISYLGQIDFRYIFMGVLENISLQKQIEEKLHNLTDK